MKKALQKLIAFILALAFLNPMYAEVPTLGYAMKFRNEQRTTASLVMKKTVPVATVMAADPDTKCRRFKTMRNAGIGLLCAGPAAFVSGVALVIIGSGDAYYNGGGLRTVGIVGGGAVLMVFGILMTGAGIPLTIIGSKKSKQWCNQSTGELKMNVKGNGVGFAYRF